MEPGSIVQSNGKYEPKHWFHLVLSETPTQLNTRCMNGFNRWTIDKDGYEEVTLREAEETPFEYIESILMAHFRDNLSLENDLVRKMCSVLEDYYTKTSPSIINLHESKQPENTAIKAL